MDTFSRQKRSWIMAQVKSGGNRSTEARLIAVLREHAITGWRRRYPLIGKPDFVFPKARVAVFVDGCFWHGHPRKCRMPKAHRAYWETKNRPQRGERPPRNARPTRKGLESRQDLGRFRPETINSNKVAEGFGMNNERDRR